MAHAVEAHEGPHLSKRGDNKRGSRLPWAKYADGRKWRLTRDEDWPNVRTSLQVVEMAERAANRFGLELKEDHSADEVWVQFLKPDQPLPTPAENPFQS